MRPLSLRPALYLTSCAASAFLPAASFGAPGDGVADISSMADRLSSLALPGLPLFGIVAFVVGVIMAASGIYLLAYKASHPHDTSVGRTSAVVLLLAGCLLVAIPSAAMTGVVTLFGSGADIIDPTSRSTILTY